MSIRPDIALLILACAAIVAAQRVLPIVLLSRVEMPLWLRDWLAYVPLGLVAAILTLELAVPRGGAPVLPGLLAIAAAFGVAIATRGLMAATLAGVAAYWLLTTFKLVG